jgi:hypothetical protein
MTPDDICDNCEMPLGDCMCDWQARIEFEMEAAEIGAGRELDALIAEKVMGWTPTCNGERIGNSLGGRDEPAGWCKECDMADPPRGQHARPLPPYSTDIAAAWQVAEKFKSNVMDGFTILFDPERKQWRAGALWWTGYEQAQWWEPESAMAETAPLAICLAALRIIKAIVCCTARREWIWNAEVVPELAAGRS